MHYRAGSTVLQSFLNTRIHHDKKKQYSFLPVYSPRPRMPLFQVVPSGKVEEACSKQKERDIVIATYIGNWWGNKKSLDIPGPYADPSPMKWSPVELSSLPASNQYKFVNLIRDGRNQVSSLYGIKGGIEERFRNEDPRDFFLSCCKAFRNKARIALDCARTLKNYKIYTFEEMTNRPVEAISRMMKFFGYNANMEFLKEQEIRFFEQKKAPLKHSSFKDNSQMNARWTTWEDWQVDAFKKIAGRELVELGYEKDDNWTDI